ncbi:hypothetical protein GQ600_26098 [Phytophthora cactorum]|nr:hypothetical protein GQ600_26098 [Phytophthora cactorum]
MRATFGITEEFMEQLVQTLVADEQEATICRRCRCPTSRRSYSPRWLVEFCQHHKDAPMDEIQKPLKCKVLSESETSGLHDQGSARRSYPVAKSRGRVATEVEVGVSESEETGHGVANSVSGREVTGQGVAISVSVIEATRQGSVGSVLGSDVIGHGATISVSGEEVIEHGVVVRLVSGREVTGHGMVVLLGTSPGTTKSRWWLVGS